MKKISVFFIISFISLHSLAQYSPVKMTSELMKEENQKEIDAGRKEYLLIGKSAPDFNFLSMKGEDISLSKYKGKVVFLNIFFRVCGPCMHEIPTLNQLSNSSQDDVIFISLSAVDSKVGLQSFAEYKGGKYKLAENIIVIPASHTGGKEDGYLGGKRILST